MNDKKEDKKTKKAKENAEAEANEENHSENGEAKTNEVSAVVEKKKLLIAGKVGYCSLQTYSIILKTVGSFDLGLCASSCRWRQPPRRPRRRPSPSSTTAQASSSSTIPPPWTPQPASQPPQVSHMVSLQGVLLTEEYFYQWFYKYPYRFLAQKAKLIMERLADLQWSYQVSASKMNTLKSFLNGISWLFKACLV